MLLAERRRMLIAEIHPLDRAGWSEDGLGVSGAALSWEA